jgi:hypothetical protein
LRRVEEGRHHMGQSRASRHEHRITVSGRGAYKASDHGEARTGLSRLGPLESLILEYAVEVAEEFTPSDIVVYARKKHGIKLDRRRVYDALQRLVKRGALTRPRRGWYRLSESIDLTSRDVKLREARERLLDHALTNSRAARGDRKDSELMALARVLGVGVVGCGVVRVHGRGGDLVSFFFEVAYAYYVLGYVLRGLEAYLRGVGYSAGFVERVRGVARGLALRAVGCEAVVGVHGRRGSRRRGLLPLIYAERLKFTELGVDILVHEELPKVHVKVYTAESPYVQRAAPLTAWSSRRVR